MSLVGDLLISARELMTDLPQSLGSPTIGAATAIGGSGLPTGNYSLVATQLNQWGESSISNEVTVGIVLAGNISVPITCSPSATGIRVYFGLGAGAESAYQQFSISGGSGTLILDASSIVSQSPPSRSTAYLPDTDGQAVGAFALYRWMNQALAWAAAKNRGGLPDFGAVGTFSAQPVYNLTGYWKKLDNAWYDGYPLGLGRKNDVFRRSPVPGTSGTLLVYQASDRLIVECWPQPSRTSGRTTLIAPMSATDTTATAVSLADFVLGFGLVSIGNEVMEFAAANGNQLTGLTRGMGGTVPTTHSPSEIVVELNLMVSGFRVPSTYTQGSAAATLNLPPGWDEALVSYILYRFRSAEQDEASAQRYLKEATQKMSDLSGNKIIAGPRQISPNGVGGPQVAAGMGSYFGGIIIP